MQLSLSGLSDRQSCLHQTDKNTQRRAPLWPPHSRKSLRAPGVVPQFTMQSAPVLIAAPAGAAAGALAARVVPVAAAGAEATPAGMFSVCVASAAAAGAAAAAVGLAASTAAAAGATTREGASFVTGSCTAAGAGAAALSTGAEVAMGVTGAATGAGAAWVGAAANTGTCWTAAGCCAGGAATGTLTGGTACARATGAAAGACKRFKMSLHRSAMQGIDEVGYALLTQSKRHMQNILCKQRCRPPWLCSVCQQQDPKGTQGERVLNAPWLQLCSSRRMAQRCQAPPQWRLPARR